MQVLQRGETRASELALVDFLLFEEVVRGLFKSITVSIKVNTKQVRIIFRQSLLY